jgi:hypothetical protein
MQEVYYIIRVMLARQLTEGLLDHLLAGSWRYTYENP